MTSLRIFLIDASWEDFCELIVWFLLIREVGTIRLSLGSTAMLQYLLAFYAVDKILA
mgnify:CR=1